MSISGHRRGSIFWALTLIAVGAIFLYQNFNPAVRPWHIIAKFWPILIIFWGISKLIDYLQSRAHPETTPPPLFAASEVVLLVLVLVLGTAISKIVLRPWPQWPGALGIDMGDEGFAELFLDSYTYYTPTLSVPIKPQARFLLVNRRGNVEVHGTDQTNVEAIVKKTIRASDAEAAQKLSDQLKIEIVEQAGQYVLQTNLDTLPDQGRAVRLDIALRLPRTTATEITAERGDINIEGLQADQTLTTKRGDVTATNLEGLVRVHKSRGDTEIRDIKGSVEVDGRGSAVEVAGVTGTVTVNGEFSGVLQFLNVAQTARFASSRTNLMVQKLRGRVYLELGSLAGTGIDGPFEISTRQKDIFLEDFKHSVKIINTNGDVRLRTLAPPTQPIEVELKKGEIDLALPEASSFHIEAHSRHGDVDCDFSGPNLKIAREGESPSVTGTYGKGGPPIRLSTSYGTIRLAHVGTQAPTPLPPEAPSPKETKRTSLDVSAPATSVAARLCAAAPWQSELDRALRWVNRYVATGPVKAKLCWLPW